MSYKRRIRRERRRLEEFVERKREAALREDAERLKKATVAELETRRNRLEASRTIPISPAPRPRGNWIRAHRRWFITTWLRRLFGIAS